MMVGGGMEQGLHQPHLRHIQCTRYRQRWEGPSAATKSRVADQVRAAIWTRLAAPMVLACYRV